MDENRSRPNSRNSEHSVEARRKRRQARERRRRMRRLCGMIAFVVCFVLLPMLFLPEKEPSHMETQPTNIATDAANTVVPIPSTPATEPGHETTAPVTAPPATVLPTTVPPTIETEETLPITEFSIENSPAYQKLLGLPNAENYLCNEFGYNFLEIFAEFIDSQEGFMEAYPEKWHLQLYADAAASLTCHTSRQEDGSYRYYEITIYDGNDILSHGEVGARYFTDIPREEISALVYSADDPVGVDETIKELFIEYILYSDTFAWSILDPSFQSEWYYDVVTLWPYPEQEPDNHYDQLRLFIDVWRPGMAEDERYHFWLIYDEDQNEAGFGYELEGSYDEMVLTGIVPKN